MAAFDVPILNGRADNLQLITFSIWEVTRSNQILSEYILREHVTQRSSNLGILLGES